MSFGCVYKKFDFPGGSDGKASVYNAGDPGSIPGWGRSPGEGNGNPLQYSWKIPWTEEPGGLQSTGSQRVGHDRATSLHFIRNSFKKTEKCSPEKFKQFTKSKVKDNLNLLLL